MHVWFLSIVNKDTDKFDFIVFWINGFLAGSNVFGLFFLFTFELNSIHQFLKANSKKFLMPFVLYFRIAMED